MHLWTLSSVLLAVAAIVLAIQPLDEDAKGGSLRSALDAVSSRQRDIASGKQFFGLGSYREDADDLSFLAQDTDPQTGDGQPENIGYGFQKSRTNHHTYGEPQKMNNEIEDQERKKFEKLAVEYLKEEFQKIDDANNQNYQAGGEEKRSSFRERELPERYSSVSGKMRNGFRKRTSLGAYQPTSFRERNYKGETDDEKRRRIMKSINRRMGQEREEPVSEDEDEYAKMIQSLWERYRESDPNLADIEHLSESDVDTLLNYLEDNGSGRKLGEGGSVMKRTNIADGRLGAGYGYRDFVIQKRGKQLLDEEEAPSNAFLYSLKFVSPEYNREAVEQMRDIEGIDSSGENDADILRLGLKSMEDPERSEDEEWHSSPQNEQNMEEYGQELPLNFLPHAEHGRKRCKAAHQHSAGMNRKRFPVAKRSPAFRNYGQESLEYGKIRMKKSAQGESHKTTDPKVASELSHIFESPSNENTNKLTPLIIGNHVVTKQKMIPSTTLPPKVNSSTIEMTVIVNVNRNENVSSVESSHLNEEMEQPVAMSRLEAPIEVKKKSIDWTDYFGLDKRRKKTGLPTQTGNGIVGNDNWLVNQYYKSVASAANKKVKVTTGQRDKKDIHLAAQPFDTRLYDENNLRTHQPIFKAKKDHVYEVDEARIDKMDMKLRNIEDVIINEAVKYTGAHEGSTDSKEVQEVKDKVISRLAAAYNLEKMRKALSEFKSSLLAQKMSTYNPENIGTPVDVEEKRGGLSKLKLGCDKKPNTEKNLKEGYPNDAPDINGSMDENMSEGYMGGFKSLQNERYANECPIFGNVLKKCRKAELTIGFADYDFLSLCTLHQICYVCGSEVGSDSMSACDGMFLDKAEAMCRGDMFCEKSALRWMMTLKQHHPTDVLGVGTRCWESFCTSQPVVDMAR